MKINLDQLKEAVNFGCNIEFRYKDMDYTILSWIENKIVIGPQLDEDKDEFFNNFDEFVNGYKINNKSLSEIIGEIEILFM